MNLPAMGRSSPLTPLVDARHTGTPFLQGRRRPPTVREPIPKLEPSTLRLARSALTMASSTDGFGGCDCAGSQALSSRNATFQEAP